MFKILIFFLFFNSSFQSELFDKNRVINGNEAQPHSRPYQAGLIVFRSHSIMETQTVCGGSLISRNFVLTSSFCLHESPRLQVVLGAHQLFINDPTTQQRFDLTSLNYIRHPEYNVGQMKNDIALLRLPRDAIFNSFVQPIKLPSRDLETKDLVGQRIEVAGEIFLTFFI